MLEPWGKIQVMVWSGGIGDGDGSDADVTEMLPNERVVWSQCGLNCLNVLRTNARLATAERPRGILGRREGMKEG